jgi:hypothetical protein
MANLATHRLASTKAGEVVHTVKITAAADVNANGYTVTDDPANVVASVAKSAEGIAVVTLNQAWVGLSNAIATLSIDDHTVTLDAEDVDGAKTLTMTFRTGGSDADPDGAVIRLTLFLRLL